jgi:hypothetical protein
MGDNSNDLKTVLAALTNTIKTLQSTIEANSQVIQRLDACGTAAAFCLAERPRRANLHPAVPHTSRRGIFPSSMGNLIPSPSSIDVSRTSISSVSWRRRKHIDGFLKFRRWCAHVVHPGAPLRSNPLNELAACKQTGSLVKY